VGGLSARFSGSEFAEAPPTPKSELRSSRPHRFAGGGEELMAMAARPALQNWQALRWHTEI
jgi:hypothetical protein